MDNTLYADGIEVSRLRVSYLAKRFHGETIDDLRMPGKFMNHLRDSWPIEGLHVTLPFPFPPNREDVEWQFWSHLAERPNLQAPARGDIAESKRLLRVMMPLRHQADLVISPPFETPRLEAFLYPFGWVVIATVDICWEKKVSLLDAAHTIGDQQGGDATVGMGGKTCDATLFTAADVAANMLSRRLAYDPPIWPDEGHRLVTAISGSVGYDPTAMPMNGGPLHQVLQQMTGAASNPIALADDAFVAQWASQGKFAWLPTDLVYMLSHGTSVVLPRAMREYPATRLESTSARHRRLALLLSYLSAMIGLIRSHPPIGEGSLRHLNKYSELAIDRLDRLFAPNPAQMDYWGLESRAYLEKIGAVGDIAKPERRGDSPRPPTPFPRYIPPPYPDA